MGYIADIMANARKISSKKCSTFEEFSNAILECVLMLAKNGHRLDLVFERFWKKKTRNWKSNWNQCGQWWHTLPIQMDRLCPSNTTKHNLELLLSQRAITQAKEKPSDLQVFVSSFSGEPGTVPCLSCCDGLSYRSFRTLHWYRRGRQPHHSSRHPRCTSMEWKD